MTRRDLIELRTKLMALYPDARAALRVAKDADVPLGNLDGSGALKLVWGAVLDEAEKVGRVDAVIAVATSEYPEAMDRSDALSALYETRDEQRSQGIDTRELDEEIKSLKRAMREGPQLEAGRYLDDRFKLIAELGHGGFATVWKAYDRDGRCHVAVKVLHGQWARDRSRIERFERGARALKRLRHSNIVRIEQLAAEDGGFHYFVMEYVDGGTLREAVLEKRINTAEALRIVAAVGDALVYAHAEGVLHRDVKPANILLRRDGTGVLSDFDLAQLSDSTGGTGTGAMGTFLYMAPESMENAQNADARSDVFSLGCTAAFALLGRELTLRDHRNPKAALAKIECAQHLRDAIERAMAEERDARFPDVGSFVGALRATGPMGTIVPKLPDLSMLHPWGGTVPGLENHRLPPPIGYPSSNLRPPLPVGNPASHDGQPPSMTTPPVAQGARPWGRGVIAGAIGLAAMVLIGAVMRWGQSVDHSSDGGIHAAIDGAVVIAHDAAVAVEGDGGSACPDGMALIEGGEFLMGSPESDTESQSDERPQHRVRVSTFCMDRAEVTVDAYRTCTGCTPPNAYRDERGSGNVFCNWGRPNAGNDPVNCVDWAQAKAFCESRGGSLPTEAQWEFAARGTGGRRYPWGPEEPDVTRTNLCGEECVQYARARGHTFTGIANWRDPFGSTAPVGSFSLGATPGTGLLDMAGNVWEWTADWYADHYETSDASLVVDPTGPAAASYRVLRGGGWGIPTAAVARAAFRYNFVPTARYFFIGFRCARGAR